MRMLSRSISSLQTMVQDDEYVSISSANLNQRSLDGTRDTELGMGSWQPAHTLATAQHGKPTSPGPGHSPGNGDSVHAGPAEGFMGERGGNYADIDMHQGQPSAPKASTVTSSSRSVLQGSQGQEDSTRLVQGKQAVATGAGAVLPASSSHEEEQAGAESTLQQSLRERDQSDAVSQHMEPAKIGSLSPQPPSATWGQGQHPRSTPDAVSNLADLRPRELAQPSPDTEQAQPRQACIGQQSSVHAEHAVPGQRGPGVAKAPVGDVVKAGQEEEPVHGGVKAGQGVAYPKGEVYGYRMALWLEHLGGKFDPVYDQPHSLECVKRVNSLAQQNWLQFDGNEDIDMSGHLITFPVVVDRNGDLKPLAENGQFSDIDNTVVGKSRPIPAMFLN